MERHSLYAIQYVLQTYCHTCASLVLCLTNLLCTNWRKILKFLFCSTLPIILPIHCFVHAFGRSCELTGNLSGEFIGYVPKCSGPLPMNVLVGTVYHSVQYEKMDYSNSVPYRNCHTTKRTRTRYLHATSQ